MSRLFFVLLGEIGRLRKENRVSQTEAGRFIGCNQSQYGKKERGVQQFTLEEYCRLIEKLVSERDRRVDGSPHVPSTKPWFVEFFGNRILYALGTKSEHGEQVLRDDTRSGADGLHDAAGLIKKRGNIDIL